MSKKLVAGLLIEANTKKEQAAMLRRKLPGTQAVADRQKLIQRATELDHEVDRLEAMASMLPPDGQDLLAS
jgi:hypothetical protein